MARSIKIRRVDYSPDEYIAGVGGLLNAYEQSVYWMVCSLIMSRGGPVEEDHGRIGRLCMLRPSTVAKLLDGLVATHRKLSRSEGKLSQKRAESELELAQNRVETAQKNGKKGGRPLSNINEVAKPAGYSGEKLTINHQPPTTNHQKEEDDARASSAREPTRAGVVDDSDFDSFWKAYPHKVGKADARKKYESALKRATSGVIMAGLERYIATKHVDRQWCNPATWLHQERWLDEPDLPLHGGAQAHGPRSPVSPASGGAESATARAARLLLDDLESESVGDDRQPPRTLLGKDDGRR